MPVLDCIPIKLRCLPQDVYLECKVYFRKPGSAEDDFSLLCENQTVTPALINRLKRAIFPESRIYIPRKYVIDNLFAKGHDLEFSKEEIASIKNHDNLKKREFSKLPTSDGKPHNKESNAEFFKEKAKAEKRVQKFGEVVKRYDQVKDGAENMLKIAASTGKIDKDQSAVVVQGVQAQIDETDVSLIIQTINRIRTVDEYLHTHSLNVAYLNGLMGRWLNFDPVRQNELVETGLYHDVGKIGINPNILHKTDDLSREEFEELKRHPVLSLETLIKSGVRNKAVLEGVIQHHERVNGTGYPKGLMANEICEYARITAISDTYDAMVTKRVYKDSHSPFVILNEFEKGGYSELDIAYVNIFVNCMVDELKGKEVVMSDGSEAVVLLVNPRDLLYPIVEIDGEVVITNESLYCMRMKNLL